MCCFSRKVNSVSNTHIFARASKEGKQFLVYSMQFKAAEDLAMILPLPTPKASKEDALRFLSFDKYPDFFPDLLKGFPIPKELGFRGKVKSDEPDAAPKLKVIEVGSFVASFVPKVADFARLDEQFRLPTETWDKLPQYKDWGFAVFKLKKGEQKVHPMAFEFPRRDDSKLFFPTVHIHDGTVPEKARFDHTLLCQFSGEDPQMWEESDQPAELFFKKFEESHGIVEGKDHVYRKVMRGVLPNKDVVV